MIIANSRLPKYVGWAAFIIYLVTLAHGVTMDNLAWTARVADWDLQPLGNQPLLWLVTLPLRWLPSAWVAVELNILSACFGAWTLGLLARSVQILPQNRTPVQRIFVTGKRGIYEKADNWAPAVLAAVLCGLEFNFWQQSVAAVGETLHILLFAAALRWLLEYRMDRSPRYLRKALFIWGLGMAENWAMILLLPLFLGALVWLRGRRVLSIRFLLFAFLAGFSIYLIPAIVNSLFPHATLSFSDALHASLRDTKQTLTDMQMMFWKVRKDVGGLIVASFILPLLPSLIRIRSDGAYQKSLSEKIQIMFNHVTHALILIGCLWITLDPALGPRQMMESQMSVTMPLLLFDYLAALGAGYIAGYFLVIYGGQYKNLFRRKNGKHRPPFAPRWMRRLTPIFLHSLPVAMAMLLCLRNLVPIININRQPLNDFGELAASSLPTNGHGIVMCDDLMRAIVLRAAMSKEENQRWQVVNSASLVSAGYRDWLERKHPGGWLAEGADRQLGLVELLRLLDQLALKNQIFYLHPAYGYFFDAFYLVPHGAVYELKRYGENLAESLNPPPLDADSINAGEKFWDSAWRKNILSTSEVLAHHPRDFLDSFFSGFNTEKPKDNQSRLLGQWYSMALNHWGVELQHLAQLPAAQRRFEQALDTATNNRAANFNLTVNTNLQAGNKMNLGGVTTLNSSLRGRTQLNSMLERYGPFDEPNFCYVFGNSFLQSGLFRQAMQAYERAWILAPDAPAAGFALTRLYAKWHLDDRLFAAIKRIRDNPRANGLLADAFDAELALTEAKAWAARTNLTKASETLEALRQRYPNRDFVGDMVMQAYLSYGDYANGLRCAKAAVAAKPKNADALVTESFVLLMMNRPAEAIPVLTEVLSITNSPKALLNRAAANTQLGNLNEAEADYKLVTNYPEGAYQLHYGLAEIAIKRHDTNSAIQQLELCVLNSQLGSTEWQEAKAHLAFYKKGAEQK